MYTLDCGGYMLWACGFRCVRLQREKQKRREREEKEKERENEKRILCLTY